MLIFYLALMVSCLFVERSDDGKVRIATARGSVGAFMVQQRSSQSLHKPGVEHSGRMIMAYRRDVLRGMAEFSQLY
jgi:hypothetical protein